MLLVKRGNGSTGETGFVLNKVTSKADMQTIFSSRIPYYSYPKDTIPEYMSILVPNVDNIRTDFLVGTIMKQVSEQISLMRII